MVINRLYPNKLSKLTFSGQQYMINIRPTRTLSQQCVRTITQISPGHQAICMLG